MENMKLISESPISEQTDYEENIFRKEQMKYKELNKRFWDSHL